MLFFSITLSAHSGDCRLTNGLNVNTAKRLLTICKNGNAIKRFSVAIGYNGAGKKRRGDNKTPVGLYGLAHPRPSKQFKVFIPIGYPTASQRAAGYSGRDVGIHGPTQSFGLFGLFGNLPGATRGCVAVGRNSQIEYIANWVKANPGTKVLIV